MAFPESGRLATDADHARMRLDALADRLSDLVADLRHEIERLDDSKGGGGDERTDDAERDGGGVD